MHGGVYIKKPDLAFPGEPSTEIKAKLSEPSVAPHPSLLGAKLLLLPA